MAKRDPRTQALIKRVLSDFEIDLRAWEPYCEKFRQRYRAYRGMLELRSEAASWTNKQHPAIIFQALETMSANLIDPSPKWRLRARPVITSPEEANRLRDGAKANELLLNYQLSCDHWAEKQRAYDLQALITGISVSKQYWDYREGDVRSQQSYEEPFYNDYGDEVGSVPRLRDVSSRSVLRDDPTSEVVDVFDWVPHKGAISLQACDRVHHRVWYTLPQLREMEQNGRYGPAAGGEPVSLLEDRKGPQPERRNRGDIFDQTRPEDQIEVVESWVDRGRKVVTVAGRDVLLEERANPNWFDYLDYRFPFAVCSGTPDLFRIPGISEVELMQDLQEMLWTLMNQRLDSLQLLSNAIFLLADDIEDPDAFEFEPGARWSVPRPVDETIKPWSPDPNVPQMTIAAEGMIRKDVQDITGAGVPFQPSPGADQTTQQTATGVSIVTTLAQKRLAAKKQQFVWAKRRIGEQWCALNQQYVREERLVPIVGKDGAEDWFAIRPEMLQGVYVFETEMVDDSLLRAERRAEHQAKLQVALNGAPVMAAIGQPLNLRAFWEDYLGTFDISEKEIYFSAAQQQLSMQGQSGQPQPGAAPSQNGGGITNEALAAGPSSPSNETSMNPEQAMQQMFAMRGGPVNQ